MTVWHEQAVTIPGTDDLVLEGAWQSARGPGGGVIAAPHPLMGGSLEHPVVNELAYALYRTGLPSLRFNWRGVGASQGTASAALELADRDYDAALEHLCETVSGPIVGAGYSFGAAVAVRVAGQHPRVDTLMLVAPPAALLGQLSRDALVGRTLIVVGERDELAPVAAIRDWLLDAPGIELAVLPGADHAFHASGLGALLETARDFLSRRR